MRTFEPPWINFSVQRLFFAVSRTVTACAQMSMIVFTPAFQYFQPILGQDNSPSCSGILKISVYCIGLNISGLWLGHVICAIVLLSVIVGIYPRLTAWLHVWITFSIGNNFGLTDGGETVAQFLVVFLAIMSIADARRNHWSRKSRNVNHNVRAIAWVAWNGARIQLAFIYFFSSVAKLNVDRWVDGSAFYYFVRDPMFGASGALKPALYAVTLNPILVATLTWSGIALQFAIAILILKGPRARLIALLLDIVLHIGITLTMGLWSFSVIMIGFAILCLGTDKFPFVDNFRGRIIKRFSNKDEIERAKA